MKKIVFTLVALAGLLSATEYLKIDGDVVLLSNDNNLATVFKISDIAYTAREANKNLIVLTASRCNNSHWKQLYSKRYRKEICWVFIIKKIRNMYE